MKHKIIIGALIGFVGGMTINAIDVYKKRKEELEELEDESEC